MTQRPVIFISATGQRPHQGRVAAILLPLIAVALAGSLGWWFAHPSLPDSDPATAAQAPSLSDSAPDPQSQGGISLRLAQIQDKLRHQEQRLGPWHADTLETRLDQARTLWTEHRQLEAIAAFRAILAIQERTLGSDHPDTLRCRDELAKALSNYNMEADAEYRTILAIRQRTLGAEHPDTLQTFHQLAEHLMYQHKDAEAEAEFRCLLAIQERILGATAPDTLRSRSDIGRLLSSQHRYPEAEAHYRSLLSDLEKIYGAQHEEVLWVHLSLAYVLEVQNRLPEALVHVKLGEKLDEYNSLIPPDPISLKRSDYLQRKIEEAEGKEPGR